jgi:HEAT repeat protein
VPTNLHTPPSHSSEQNPLKVQGLAFGQAFQTMFKVSVMYSVDHPAAGRSIQQVYDLVKPLLKQGGQFTFGFVNQLLLLNSSLVSHTSLTHLEAEFSKRQIGAISFHAGVALKDFKRAITLLTTKPSVIAERGGTKSFLAANPLEGIRIIPAEKRDNQGGTIEMGMDIESYLTAQAILEPDAQSGAMALDLLLQAAGIQKPQRFGGSGREMLELVNEATRNTVADPQGNLAKLLVALTQMLAGLKSDYLLSSLSPEKQNDLRGYAPGEMAAHLMEDVIAGWAAERLATSQPTEGLGGVGEEVLQALLRGLKATHVAERLLQKLAQFVKQANLPPEVYERIRREVVWFTLPAQEKHAQLLRLERFTPQQFARLLHYVEEAMSEGRFAEATEITQHYFAVLDKTPPAERAEELKRAPDLLRSLAGAQTRELMHTLAEPLVRELLDETRLHWPCHMEVTNCLAVVAQNAGRLDDFEFVHKIATDLKRSLARHSGQHLDCCGNALTRILAPADLERLIESCLQKRSDAAWVRTATSLLMMIGPLGAEVAFRRLDEEPAASNRLPLIRLIRNLGTAAIEATRKRLADERWYVVRNACQILGDLGDPELPAQLRGAVRHPEPTVQRAAITALLKSNAGGRGEVLAQALPSLHAGVLEMALDELMILKDPASVDHLETLVLLKKDFKAGVLEKAVRALAAIPSDRSAEALYKILADAGQGLPVRRVALGGLYNHPSAAAVWLVARLADLPPGDPLRAQLKKGTDGSPS